jgi:hypothetical protein
MIYIVDKLPDDVKLSEHLRGMAEFYLCVQSFGINYYIPATPRIRQLVELDSKGLDAPRDKRRRWDRYEKGDALRDIVAAIELQVRDVVLAGIERNVMDALLKRLEIALDKTVVRAVADRVTQKLLPP